MNGQWTVTLSIVVSAAIAVIGWIANWLNTRALNRRAGEKSKEDARMRSQDLDNMRHQLAALQKQADALTEQVRMDAKRESVPKWEISQVKGIVYEVSNLNSFAASNVNVSFDGGEYELGNIAVGSQQTFDFFETQTMGGPNQVTITWEETDTGETRHVDVAVP